MANILKETAPPNMVVQRLNSFLPHQEPNLKPLFVTQRDVFLLQGEQPPVIIPSTPAMVNASSLGSLSLTSPTGSQPKPLNWAVTSKDRAKYDALFDSLSPINGKLPGFKVCNNFLNLLITLIPSFYLFVCFP